MSTEDKSLFISAMQDVKPLHKEKQTIAEKHRKPQSDSKQLLKKVKKRQYQQKLYSRKDSDYSLTKSNQCVEAFEKLNYSQPGVRAQEMNTLKKGTFKLDAALDLHGFNRDQAEIKIMQFLKECMHYQCRYIRVIHGKGYNSEDGFPVLKNLTYQVLITNPQVIAFHSAPEKDGGVGAINILLKAQS